MRVHRRGYSLLEITLVMVVMALSVVIMLRQLHLTIDRIEARSAARAAGNMIGRARDEALAQQTFVTVLIDTVRGDVALTSRYGPIASSPIGSLHDVTLSTSRDSITFDVRGLGFGTANLTLVARRGAAAESVVVSRLGRVRY